MSTEAPVKIIADQPRRPVDIRIYSHSSLLYWWPVWALAFLLALWTILENRYMAVVPDGVTIEANTITAPEGVSLEQRLVHVSRSPLPGAIFVTVLLFVAIFSNASLRGPWALFFGASVVALVLLLSWLQWWGPISRWIGMLRIYINLGGYLTIAVPLFLVWVATIFFFDRRTYIVFSAGQLRLRDRLGEAEKVFDAMSVTFEKQAYNWFCRLVGLGAGDLILRAGGSNREVYEMPNVVRVGRWLRLIEERLQTREVE
jgi:hypothetical protein